MGCKAVETTLNRLYFLKSSFPGVVFFQSSLVDGQFQRLSPFLSLLSLSGTFFAVGTATSMPCSAHHVPFAATQIKTKWFSTSETAFKNKAKTPQRSRAITGHSAFPGTSLHFKAHLLHFMCCFLFFSQSLLSFKPELERFSGTDYNSPPR